MIQIFKFKSFSTGKTKRAILFGNKDVVKYIISKTYQSLRGHGY